MQSSLFKLQTLVLGFTFLAMSFPVIGQEGILEEVIVTATKRETSLQATPVSVQAPTTPRLPIRTCCPMMKRLPSTTRLARK